MNCKFEANREGAKLRGDVFGCLAEGVQRILLFLREVVSVKQGANARCGGWTWEWLCLCKQQLRCSPMAIAQDWRLWPRMA